MTWTTDKPTKPGWYWWRIDADDKDPYPARVYNEDGRLMSEWHNGHEETIAKYSGGEWYGPLEVPQ